MSKRRRPPLPARAEPQPAPRRPFDIAALSVVAAALLLRLAVLWQLGDDRLLRPRGQLDDAVFVRLAERIAAGDVTLAPDVYYLSPLYTYFLGLVFALGGGTLAARVLQVGLGTAAVALIMRTAGAWFGRRAGLAAGAAAAATGLLAFNEVLILQSAIDPVLTALACYAVSRAVQHPAWRNSMMAGASLAMLALNRPNAIVLPVAVAAAWLLFVRTRTTVTQAAVFLASTMLALSPVVARNWAVSGEFTLISSQGGLNFFIGNHERADGTWRPVSGVRPTIEGQRVDVRTVAAAAAGHDVTAAEASQHFYGLAWRWIVEHPLEWVQLLARKLALALNAADTALNYSFNYFAFEQFGALSLLLVGPWCLIPLGLFSIGVWARRGPTSFRVWVVIVPAYLATLVAFFVSSRYRLPLLVMLTVAAGGAVPALMDCWRGPSKRGRAIALAALMALFVAVNWPMNVDDGRAFQREERIAQLITDGHIDEGERLLAASSALTPERTAALFDRIGLVFSGQGNAERAVTYLQRATAANTDSPAIRRHLGEALLAAGRAGDAVPYLEATLPLPPGADAATYNLARAYAAAGRADDARRLLGHVIVGQDAGAGALTRLGILAAGLGAREQARSWLAEAVRRDPGLAAARDALGVVLGQAGARLEAIDAFQGAVALEPDNASFRFHLAVALADTGQFDMARREAMTAARLRPGSREVEALLRQLPPR